MAAFILQCFYFMLPAYFANMAPVIIKKRFKKLAIPLDLNKKIKGESILGKNKTFRGLIFGIIFATIITYIQFLLYKTTIFHNLSFINYSNWSLLGFLFGFGALFGDSAESFIKRRLKIKPGQRFFPWDQLDFVIGSLVFASLATTITWKMIIYIAIISVIGHILVNHSAFYLKIRKEKW